MKPRQRTRRFAVVALGLLALGMASLQLQAQVGDEVLTIGFEDNVDGWLSLDPQGKVVPAEKTAARSGSGALEYRYTLRDGGMPLLARPLASVTGAAAVEFWVKCTHSTGVVLLMGERDDSRYGTLTYVPEGGWTRVAVNLDELQLGEDSRDENGKLDVDQINSLTIADLGIFAQSVNPEIRGPRKLWLDDVRFLRPRGTSGAGPRDGGYVVESFEGNLLRWLPVTITFDPVKFTLYPRLSVFDLTTDVPAEGGKAAMKIGYSRPRLSAFGLMRDVHSLDLKNTEKVTFAIRSDKTGTFLATLEKLNKARYQAQFSVTPNLWQKIELPVTMFSLADDSKDPDGSLDMARVKQFALMDVNLTMSDAGDNTLYLDEVVFVGK